MCLLLIAVFCCRMRPGPRQRRPGIVRPTTFEQLRQAAEAGDARAQFDLGVRYAGGKGVAANDAEAARWIALAAAQGLVDAQFNLGLMYADGNGVAVDPQQAVFWLRKAADQGDARAQSNLGLMYAMAAAFRQMQRKQRSGIARPPIRVRSPHSSRSDSCTPPEMASRRTRSRRQPGFFVPPNMATGGAIQYRPALHARASASPGRCPGGRMVPEGGVTR